MKDSPHEKGKLTTYSQVVSCLPATHDTDDVIAEAEAETTNLRPLEGMFEIRYSDVL